MRHTRIKDGIEIPSRHFTFLLLSSFHPLQCDAITIKSFSSHSWHLDEMLELRLESEHKKNGKNEQFFMQQFWLRNSFVWMYLLLILFLLPIHLASDSWIWMGIKSRVAAVYTDVNNSKTMSITLFLCFCLVVVAVLLCNFSASWMERGRNLIFFF